ncbi:nuclease-related domain-containing protein [Virgibacillus dakarensis]|uniref:nuclease-related domain-containing protein n=1 Tax=Virgibacillus dakarensis TaxID=1917889 RepID=UPI0013564BFE|nr:nuclease-related domain-containing protein [Virgibacillus dakarensis]
MAYNNRRTPIEILKLESALRRLADGHLLRPRIEEDLRKRHAGFHGEKSIDYHLSFFEHEHHLFHHGLRLPWKDTHFQIDSLITTPSMIIPLEVKNMIGRLFFDEPAQQLIQTTPDGTVKSYPYPLTQANRHVLQLQSWLRQHHFPVPPIIPFVVISNSSTIIDTNSKDKLFYDKVVHAMNLPFKLKALPKRYPDKLLSPLQQRNLSEQLIKKHVTANPEILQWYGIDKHEIRNGLYCENCKDLTMERIRGNWKCNRCGLLNKKAHIRGLLDHYLLIGSTITNRQYKSFVRLNSISIATKQLQSLGLQSTGTFKDRKYLLELDALLNLL